MGEDTLQETSVHLSFEVSQGLVCCHSGLLPFSLDPCLHIDGHRSITSSDQMLLLAHDIQGAVQRQKATRTHLSYQHILCEGQMEIAADVCR